MKVGIDAGAATNAGHDRGLGRYTAELMAAVELLDHVEATPVYTGIGHDAGSYLRNQGRVNASLKGLDVYHATSVESLPIVKKLPWVCSVLDTIPLDLDGYTKLGVKTKLQFAQAKRANSILALSNYTALRVQDLLRVDPEKIVVAPLPVSDSFFPEKTGLPTRKYIVCLVDLRTVDMRKRNHWINCIADALAQSEIAVVVTGRGIAQSDYPSCEIKMDLTDGQLRELYSAALCFFYPSAYEGQGLPPLEAMACGCPVIAFRNSAIEEMVAVDEFLIDDPIPWAAQRLGEKMPKRTMLEVVAKIHDLTTDEERLQTYRERAILGSQKNSRPKLATAIANSYDIAKKST